MLLLDFDGVLLDSQDEVILSSYNALRSSTESSLARLPTPFVNLFKINRFIASPHADVYALADWVFEHFSLQPTRVLTYQEFEQVTASHPLPREERRLRFISARRRLSSGFPDLFLRLNRPQQPVWSELCALNSTQALILSNKDRESLLAVARFFGLSLSPERIFGSEGGLSKAQNLQRLMHEHQAQDYLFVDDSIQNLNDLRRELSLDLPLTLAFAPWGYCGPEDRALADKLGFPLIEQAELIRLMKVEYAAHRN